MQNDTNGFGLDVAQYPWTHAGARVLSHAVKVVLYPFVKDGNFLLPVKMVENLVVGYAKKNKTCF